MNYKLENNTLAVDKMMEKNETTERWFSDVTPNELNELRPKRGSDYVRAVCELVVKRHGLE